MSDPVSDRWSARLSEHLDGELYGAEARELEEHLDGCTACGRELEGLRSVRVSLGRLPSAPPPERVWLGVRKRLAGDRATVARRWAWLPAFATAASAILVAGAAMWISWKADAIGTLRDAGEIPRAPGAPAGQEATLPDVLDGGSPADYGEAAAQWRDALLEEIAGPEMARVIRSNLGPYDRAIRETREELEQAPGDPLLREHLARLQQARLRFLRRAGATVADLDRTTEAG